jgi:hypothetical protein
LTVGVVRAEGSEIQRMGLSSIVVYVRISQSFAHGVSGWRSRSRSRSRPDCYAEVKGFDAGGRLLKLRGCLGGIARVALGESAGAFLRSAALSQPLSVKRTGGLG